MCLGAGVVAVARFGGLRRGIRELNFPRRLAAIGLVMLAANAALLVVYRILHRTKYHGGLLPPLRRLFPQSEARVVGRVGCRRHGRCSFGTKHQWDALGRPDGYGFPAAAQFAVG
jgi:hypothetical protein